MKMNFLLKSKIKSENRTKVITIVVLFCILFLFSAVFPKQTRGILHSLAKPVWTSRDNIVSFFKTIPKYFLSKNTLIRDAVSLKEQLVLSQLKSVDYGVLLKENEELKALMSRTNSQNRILSRVLSKGNPYDSLIIDLGRNNLSSGKQV